MAYSNSFINPISNLGGYYTIKDTLELFGSAVGLLTLRCISPRLKAGRSQVKNENLIPSVVAIFHLHNFSAHDTLSDILDENTRASTAACTYHQRQQSDMFFHH